MAANHTIEMYITASSATDIYYLIRKHLHNIEAAKMIMGKLYSLTGILEVTADDCMDALASAISDYEDAVVEKVASRKDMDYIVTRNIKDYQAGGTKIILPDDFVKLVERGINFLPQNTSNTDFVKLLLCSILCLIAVDS